MLRKKFMEKNQALEKEIKKYQSDIKELELQVSNLKKRNTDLNALKSTSQKVLEEKISQLTQSNEMMK